MAEGRREEGRGRKAGGRREKGKGGYQVVAVVRSTLNHWATAIRILSKLHQTLPEDGQPLFSGYLLGSIANVTRR
jgi:hypothetical protein